MRFLGRTAVVLAPVVAFVLSACGDRGGQNARSATVYSCDNTIVTPDGAAGCFPPDDPKYMTIALRSQPATHLSRSVGRGEAIRQTRSIRR